MAAFGVALLLGLPSERTDALGRATLPLTRPIRLGGHYEPPDERHFARLAAIGAFTAALTKPSGRIVQIGDNDSGRFFKLHPVLRRRTLAEARALYRDLDGAAGDPDDLYLDEDPLDHRPLLGALGALVTHDDAAAACGKKWLDAAITEALARRHVAVTALAPRRSPLLPSLPALVGPARTIEIIAPGGDLRAGLRLEVFGEFGVWIWRSDRLFLAIRCGRIGADGRGAHAHNDQLAFELAVDGEDWVSDPGSFVYTASRAWRNAYRSVAAHSSPRHGSQEPALLDLADFWLDPTPGARCLHFDADAFRGRHEGFGAPVERTIRLGHDRIIVCDVGAGVTGDESIECLGRAATAERFGGAVPFSRELILERRSRAHAVLSQRRRSVCGVFRWRVSAQSSRPALFGARAAMSCEKPTTTNERTMSSVETAATVGSISRMMPSHMRFGSVVALVPLRKSAMTTSSNEARKAKSAAERMLGRIKGSVTLRKALAGCAPRLRAARSGHSSTRRSAPSTTTTTIGMAMTKWARTSPPTVPTSRHAANWK